MFSYIMFLIYHFFVQYRRVHITEETLGNLGGTYQVEEGNGASRDSALDGKKTYLVIDPNTQNGTDTKPKVIVNFHWLSARLIKNWM